ncbi:MAG TPA: DUF4410 domain-containing protein [Nitrospirota bacterium]
MKQILRILLAGLAMSTVIVCAAQARHDGTAVGTYKEWNGDMDELEIIQTFNLADYSKVLVLPLDTSATPLPKADDNTFEPVKIVLKSATEIFKKGVTDGLAKTKVAVEQAEAPVKDAGVIIVRGKVVEMEPGSQALRYWISFGAGQSRTTVEGEMVDAATDKVLAKFTHAKSSGIGAFGGDYQKLMTDDAHDVGEDVGKFIAAFSPAPTPAPTPTPTTEPQK